MKFFGVEDTAKVRIQVNFPELDLVDIVFFEELQVGVALGVLFKMGGFSAPGLALKLRNSLGKPCLPFFTG